MIFRVQLGLLFVALASVLGSAGCDDSEAAFDCAISCEFWAECIDSSLDVDNCINACAAREATDPDFPSQVADCDDCIVENVGANCDNAEACRNDCEPVVESGEQ